MDEDYYATIVGTINWENANIAIYNGYEICAHPSPYMSTSKVNYDTIGWYGKARDRLYVHTSICKINLEEGLPIWRILKEIDSILMKQSKSSIESSNPT